MSRFTREEILHRLQEKIAAKQAIILGTAGAGIIAKMLDQAGIDLILAYDAAELTMEGSFICGGNLAYEDANQRTKHLGKRMLKVVQSTPVIAGIGAADPYANIEQLIEDFLTMGYSGISHLPSVTAYGDWFRKRVDTAGVGFSRELNLISNCHRQGIFTVAYAHTEDDARAMAGAGADVIGVNPGEAYESFDIPVQQLPLEDACSEVQRRYEAVREENPETIVLVHDGVFNTPADVQKCLACTDIAGFMGESGISLSPMEQAIAQVIKEYKILRRR